MRADLEPCPFCNAALKHVESVARSFNPPRTYHEYHHPRNDCMLFDGVIASFTDYPAPRLKWIEAWNRRASLSSPQEPEPVASSIYGPYTPIPVGCSTVASPVEPVVAAKAEAEAFEVVAKKAEEEAELLEQMRGVYPGDPYGHLGDDAKKMRRLARDVRRLRPAAPTRKGEGQP